MSMIRAWVLLASLSLLVLAAPAPSQQARARVHGSSSRPQLSLETLQRYYQYTPAGYVLRNCVRTVPSGTVMQERSEGLTAVYPNGSSSLIPPCRRPHVSLPTVLRALPPDYDGWLAYTAFNRSAGFDAFVGSFNVPDTPRSLAHILYLFTGLQNIDWVPLVDPESEGASFDIIQPVLQYPGDNGNYWSVKSWYVTLTEGATASNELRLNVGDSILANMTRTGPTSWYIGGTQSGTQKSSYLVADHSRLRTQAWAYNVLEAYGMAGCAQYPNGKVDFTSLSLVKAGGGVIPPSEVQWRANPKPDPKHFCSETINVVDGGHVTISFK